MGSPCDFTGMTGTVREQDREPLDPGAFFTASLKRLEETYRKERDYQDAPHHGPPGGAGRSVVSGQHSPWSSRCLS